MFVEQMRAVTLKEMDDLTDVDLDMRSVNLSESKREEEEKAAANDVQSGEHF